MSARYRVLKYIPKALHIMVLKKGDADPDKLKSYRPIYILTFISKDIERIVVDQITRHLENANLMPPLQSAYCRNLSTETALMKVVSDILNAADVRKVTLLGLLDLSATFDTVDTSSWCRLALVDWFWSNSGLSLQTDPRLSHSMASHLTTPLTCTVSHRVLGSSAIHPVHCWRCVDCCSVWCRSSFIRWW